MEYKVGEKVVTGYWDGQPIWRERTAEEVLIHELNKMEKRGEKDCKVCEGSGVMYVSDGHDDVDGEICDCVMYPKK